MSSLYPNSTFTLMLLMKQRSLLMVILVILGGCAKHSGVVQVGPDTFMISRQADINLSDIGNLRADAILEAYQYCISQNKFMRVAKITEFFPDISRGFPRAEVQFMCLEESDARFTRPESENPADIVIEIK